MDELKYQFDATVVRVIDGDTVRMRVDVGFGVEITKNFRLLDIDTPELRGGTEETKAAGRALMGLPQVPRILTARCVLTSLVSAEGYGDFTFKNYHLFPGLALLTPGLRAEPVVDDFTSRPRALAEVECDVGLPSTGATLGVSQASSASFLLLALAAAGLALAATGASGLLLRRR